ncbi:STAS domain-containing protein [Streptomyces montanisoli]|uniref:STAS domain-containing protein n=1 Tax=Streptomyces montanisoli TaxID=2798581 RepID=A0A940RV61_9ACTN|nr:STAS domain-containing protein [Streptomyces montanisoli]MBP0457945.1 STAS domain-containing protein [Streptomyces montanisoli]
MADTERIVLILAGPLTAGSAPRACAELAARAVRGESGGAPLVEVRVGLAVRADLAAVEALARLRLTARRHGCELVVRGASAELVALLHALGLGRVLLAEGPSAAG